MTTERRVEPIAPAQRRTLHPLLAIAAVAVTAVSLIAAAQLLWPRHAQSQSMAPPAADSTAVPAKTAVVASEKATAAPAPKPAAPAACADCGVVVAVHESKQPGQGTGVGAVAGGVLGGVLGHQFGGGRGNDALTAVGVVGGAIAGNQVEKQARAKIVYRIDVKMDNGGTRTVTHATPVAVGARVHVDGNQITLRG